MTTKYAYVIHWNDGGFTRSSHYFETLDFAIAKAAKVQLDTPGCIVRIYNYCTPQQDWTSRELTAAELQANQ